MNAESAKLIRQTLNAILYQIEHGRTATIDGKAVLILQAHNRTTIAAWIAEARDVLDGETQPVAPITPIVDPTSKQTDGEAFIDLSAPFLDPTKTVTVHTATGYCSHPVEAVQAPREGTQDATATRQPSEPEIASHTQEQTAFVADALPSLTSMPEVSSMVCCQHNGPGKPACDACRKRAERFVPPSHEETLELERQILPAAAARTPTARGNGRKRHKGG